MSAKILSYFDRRNFRCRTHIHPYQRRYAIIGQWSCILQGIPFEFDETTMQNWPPNITCSIGIIHQENHISLCSVGNGALEADPHWLFSREKLVLLVIWPRGEFPPKTARAKPTYAVSQSEPHSAPYLHNITKKNWKKIARLEPEVWLIAPAAARRWAIRGYRASTTNSGL